MFRRGLRNETPAEQRMRETRTKQRKYTVCAIAPLRPLRATAF
jgi:hypothetical protein